MVSLDTAIFIIIAIMEISAAYLIFFFKNLMHSAIALSTVFGITSLVFAFLGNPLLAVFQLFIMVGGISVYIFVGVAAPGLARFRHFNPKVLLPLSILIFMVLAYPLLSITFAQPSTNVLQQSDVTQTFTSGVPIFYVIMLLLFAVSLGAIILIKIAKRQVGPGAVK
jgi:NADH:ubiquinone oxidoreductase subunit 6 (subunit J)